MKEYLQKLGESYEYTFEASKQHYFFFSVGINGKFKKRVSFVKYGKSKYWELVLEDYVEKLDTYAYNTVTDNNDLDRIYSTMFDIMIDYSKQNPEKQIITMGTTKTIQRLDRIFIQRHIDLIKKYFLIRTYHETNIELSNKDFESSFDCTGYLFFPLKND